MIAWARKRNLVDKPDARKIHKNAIARVGGIAIFVGTMLAILPVLFLENHLGEAFRGRILQIGVLLLGSTFMFWVGLHDDIKGVRVRTKLAAQIAVALMVCMAGIHIHEITIRNLGVIHLGWFCYVVTFVWIIGITNAVNLIDGLDGLAGGISAIACGAIAAMAMLQDNWILAVTMVAICGSLLGFLFFNFHPARIFMGDCGSLFLGFVIATASIMTATKSVALFGICLPILVLGIPIFDTLLSMLRRFVGRRGIMSPDRGHFHHRLMDMGLKQHHVAIIAYIITSIITALGLIMVTTTGRSSVVLFLACLLLLLLVFRLIGVVKLRQSLEGLRQRITISQQQRAERKIFEETQLLFHNAKTFDQWWDCMCKAAAAMGFSRLSLKMKNGSGEQVHKWQRQAPSHSPTITKSNRMDRTETSDPLRKDDQALEDMLEISLPVREEATGNRGRFEIQVMPKGSLESAGRRAALFARLADEHNLGTIQYHDITGKAEV